MSDPLVEALIAHFDSSFAGPNGDYPSVLEALASISAAQAVWKPSPQSNSIWQIVDHLAASKVWLMDMLEKGEAALPVWTEPEADEASWQASLARLQEAHNRLKHMLRQLRAEELMQSPIPDTSQTLLELILSSGTAHEAHHAGQIDYLKGLQS